MLNKILAGPMWLELILALCLYGIFFMFTLSILDKTKYGEYSSADDLMLLCLLWPLTIVGFIIKGFVYYVKIFFK